MRQTLNEEVAEIVMRWIANPVYVGATPTLLSII
jgi:hypothetical protein